MYNSSPGLPPLEESMRRLDNVTHPYKHERFYNGNHPMTTSPKVNHIKLKSGKIIDVSCPTIPVYVLYSDDESLLRINLELPGVPRDAISVGLIENGDTSIIKLEVSSEYEYSNSLIEWVYDPHLIRSFNGRTHTATFTIGSGDDIRTISLVNGVLTITVELTKPVYKTTKLNIG